MTDEHERKHLAHEANIPFDPACWRCQAEERDRELGGDHG